ncbi:unnamed protein product [Hydatigera taeniaeformis]|uniref:PUL domain-containing protein n=1 Tax=Hydatigena taeniaeformis TaxID=6205 RepID=A0A3P7FSH7_HYDTA|nr:unnamed protein product [Hydatigera taeniaeformis]
MRLAYALGNVAGCCESVGGMIFSSKEGAIKMCMLCEEYAANSARAKSNPIIYDALIKLTRIIVNACVGAAGGIIAADTPECTSVLLRLLKISADTQSTNDELLINGLAGLNNITFYMTTTKEREILTLQTEVGQGNSNTKLYRSARNTCLIFGEVYGFGGTVVNACNGFRWSIWEGPGDLVWILL